MVCEIDGFCLLRSRGLYSLVILGFYHVPTGTAYLNEDGECYVILNGVVTVAHCYDLYEPGHFLVKVSKKDPNETVSCYVCR
jgi:hypothetical protein